MRRERRPLRGAGVDAGAGVRRVRGEDVKGLAVCAGQEGTDRASRRPRRLDRSTARGSARGAGRGDSRGGGARAVLEPLLEQAARTSARPPSAARNRSIRTGGRSHVVTPPQGRATDDIGPYAGEDRRFRRVGRAALSSASPVQRAPSVGAWRSLVARIVRDDEVGGSNPLAPTRSKFLLAENSPQR